MYELNIITEDTPVCMLTVRQQKELIASAVKEALSGHDPESTTTMEAKRYVYGISGIASLFQVSHATAIKIKNGVIKPAVMQQGRKIVVDAEMALELFREGKK